MVTRPAHAKPSRLRLAWHRWFHCCPDREPLDRVDEWTCPTCEQWFFVQQVGMFTRELGWHVGERPESWPPD